MGNNIESLINVLDKIYSEDALWQPGFDNKYDDEILCNRSDKLLAKSMARSLLSDNQINNIKKFERKSNYYVVPVKVYSSNVINRGVIHKQGQKRVLYYWLYEKKCRMVLLFLYL